MLKIGSLKLDKNLIPVVMILYLLSFLDRVNIGWVLSTLVFFFKILIALNLVNRNARLYGLEEDLHMKGQMFQIVR